MLSNENKFWSDGGIPLDELTVWIVQFCNACGHRSMPVKSENELIDTGWIIQINFNLCPSCRQSILNLIRSERVSH